MLDLDQRPEPVPGRQGDCQLREAHAQTTAKPNILVIMGNDIGLWNISVYNRGMMSYRTWPSMTARSASS